MTNRARRQSARGPFVNTAAQAVLAHLARNADRALYDRQVAGETGLSRGAANGALRALARARLLRVETRGRMKFYRADLDDARVRALKTLLNISGLHPTVVRLRRLSRRVVLFGSTAEGRDLPASDQDLLVVTDSPDAVRRLLGRARERIQAVVVTPVSLAELERNNPVFAAEVRRGIELWNAH